MPRPSKHISPDTLGGYLRAVREQLHLSLADVAKDHYSTSFISQIERNKIEPSHESLSFLANRLKLSLQDLEHLALQQREMEDKALLYKSYEDLRIRVTDMLVHKDILSALELLQDLPLSQVPPPQRWRLIALRGQCYFEQRKFLQAQQDLVYAANELPKSEEISTEQKHELMLLHLYLAGTYRELQQFDAALEHYKITLTLINNTTPFGYAAEAHWGLALLTFAQASQAPRIALSIEKEKEMKLCTALEHAENARFLYNSMGEQLRAAAVSCQIAQIEFRLGHTEKVRTYLEEILATWANVCDEPVATLAAEKRKQQEIASTVSAAACSLAHIELEDKEYQKALIYVEQALRAGKRSYKLRRADAYLMRGRILEALNPFDPVAEDAFRCATEELADTHRIAARISAHVRFGRHLLKIGKIEEGERELEQARQLSDLVSASSGTSHFADDNVPA